MAIDNAKRRFDIDLVKEIDDIKKYANVIENRLYDDCTPENLIKDNMRYMELADKHNLPYILINDKYCI